METKQLDMTNTDINFGVMQLDSGVKSFDTKGQKLHKVIISYDDEGMPVNVEAEISPYTEKELYQTWLKKNKKRLEGVKLKESFPSAYRGLFSMGMRDLYDFAFQRISEKELLQNRVNNFGKKKMEQFKKSLADLELKIHQSGGLTDLY